MRSLSCNDSVSEAKEEELCLHRGGDGSGYLKVVL